MRHKELFLFPLICVFIFGISLWMLSRDDFEKTNVESTVSLTMTDFDFMTFYQTIIDVDNAWNTAGPTEKFSAQAQNSFDPGLLDWIKRDRSKISLINNTIMSTDNESCNFNYSFIDSWTTKVK